MRKGGGKLSAFSLECPSVSQAACGKLEGTFQDWFLAPFRVMLSHKCVKCYPSAIGRIIVTCNSLQPDRFFTDSRCRFVRNGAITVEGGCFISICESVKSPLLFSSSPIHPSPFLPKSASVTEKKKCIACPPRVRGRSTCKLSNGMRPAGPHFSPCNMLHHFVKTSTRITSVVPRLSHH